MTELLVILAVALIVFGPKRLPELARSLGRALGEFRRASTELRQQLNEAADPAAHEPKHGESSGSEAPLDPAREASSAERPLPAPEASTTPEAGPAPAEEPTEPSRG